MSVDATAEPRSFPFGRVDRLDIDPLYAELRAGEPMPRVRTPYGGVLPGLRLAAPEDELPWKTGLRVRGLRALPVAWDADGTAAGYGTV